MQALEDSTEEGIKTALSLPEWLTAAQCKQVINYLFKDDRGTENGKSNFDHIKDYLYVYPSFLQLYNVDLNKQDITWWEYRTLLEGCFFNDCMIKRVCEIRIMKIPPKAKEDVKQSILSQKHKYGLRTEDSGLGTMFKALKGVSKNGS